MQQRNASLLARCQARLGLNRSQLEHPDTRIRLRLAGALLSELVRELEMPSIGLMAAQRVGSDHLALPEYLARSKRTLGEALRTSVQYAKLLCDGARHSLEHADNRVFARFWFDAYFDMPDAAYEFVLASQLNCARRITGVPDLAPLEVHFTHARPEDVALHERVFKCRVRFDMPFTQLVLPTSLLDLPLPGYEPALNRLLEQQANLSLAGLSIHNGIVERIRSLLVAELSLGQASNKRIAQRLGISSRTLARRLKEENTSYQLLFDETRRDLALRDLAQTVRPIRDIAKRLGFATSQSFHRAFRRWTGGTALGYRIRVRRSDAG